MAWNEPEVQQVVVAGAAGGLVRWITLRTDWREGLSSIGVGVLAAAYLGPVVNPLFQRFAGWAVPGGETETVAGFLVGLFGVSLTGLILDLFHKARSAARKGGDR